MENIFKIMKDFGIEMPEDKKEDFEKSVLENYKTVADYNKQVENLNKANDTIKSNDTAMKELQDKLDAFKDVDVTELKNTIAAVIYGVEYHYSSDRTVSQSGAVIYTPILTVIVPDTADFGTKAYIDAVEYSKLSVDEIEGYFTFNPRGNKDIIVAGECFKEISQEYRISQLQADYQKSGTIISLSDNTEGDLLKHYKVVCK